MATSRCRQHEDSPESTGSDSGAPSGPSDHSHEQRYTKYVQELQFDTYEMFAEDSSAANGLKWRVSHHYESQVKGSMIVIPARARRLAQEAVTLSTSLPLSYNSTVFVRCDEDRLDLMKVIHTGSGILCEFAEFCVSIMRKFQVHILIDLFLSFPQNFFSG